MVRDLELHRTALPAQFFLNLLELIDRDWENCSTVLAFGLPSLSPKGAAELAAAQTGEMVGVEMPRRVLHPVPMRDGSTEYVVCLGYADPAIRRAQQSVQDRQAVQGDQPVAHGGRTALPMDPGPQSIAVWSAVQHDAIGSGADKAWRRVRSP